MKYAFLCLLTASTLLVCPAHADEWTNTFSLTGSPRLRVETSDADIHVDTWDHNSIEARVTTSSWKIGGDGIKIYPRQNGNSVEIEVRFPRGIGFGFHRMGKVDIAIHMPREGAVELQTGDGSIDLRDFKGTMDTRTGDGRLQVDYVDGTLKARTGDGHIQVSGRFDELKLDTGDGGIQARVRPGSKVAASWELKSGDGAIDLELPQNISADLHLHTGDGHIHSEMPITVQGNVNNNDVSAKLNGGGNVITVHTGDGAIHLGKV